MARGDQGLLKFHSGPPCPTLLRPAGGRGTLEMALRPSSSLLDTPRRTPREALNLKKNESQN
jgi:hypothetical protein